MKKFFLIGCMIFCMSHFVWAEDASNPVAVTPQPVDDGSAPMAINPNTGKPFRAPYLHGTFDSVSPTEFVILSRSGQHEPIHFKILDTFPVYDVGKIRITLSDLKTGDRLKVHFQKNADLTMTVLAVYRVGS